MKDKLLNSKGAAWGAMVLVILVIVLTFTLRPVWWTFIDLFFMFMAAFCHLVAVYFMKFNRYAASRLQTAALVFGILMILADLGEYVALHYFMVE